MLVSALVVEGGRFGGQSRRRTIVSMGDGGGEGHFYLSLLSPPPSKAGIELCLRSICSPPGKSCFLVVFFFRTFLEILDERIFSRVATSASPLLEILCFLPPR